MAGPLQDGNGRRAGGLRGAAADITRDPKAFTAAIRNGIFTFLRALVSGDFEAALATLSAEDAAPASDHEPWTAERLRAALDAYYLEHERICLDPAARNLQHTYITPSEDKRHWRVQQMLIDPGEANDWVAEFDVDLARSRAAGEPILTLRRLGSLV